LADVTNGADVANDAAISQTHKETFTSSSDVRNIIINLFRSICKREHEALSITCPPGTAAASLRSDTPQYFCDGDSSIASSSGKQASNSSTCESLSRPTPQLHSSSLFQALKKVFERFDVSQNDRSIIMSLVVNSKLSDKCVVASETDALLSNGVQPLSTSEVSDKESPPTHSDVPPVSRLDLAPQQYNTLSETATLLQFTVQPILGEAREVMPGEISDNGPSAGDCATKTELNANGKYMMVMFLSNAKLFSIYNSLYYSGTRKWTVLYYITSHQTILFTMDDITSNHNIDYE